MAAVIIKLAVKFVLFVLKFTLVIWAFGFHNDFRLSSYLVIGRFLLILQRSIVADKNVLFKNAYKSSELFQTTSEQPPQNDNNFLEKGVLYLGPPIICGSYL